MSKYPRARRMVIVLIFFPVFSLFVTRCAMPVSPSQSCQKVRPVKVSGKEFIHDNSSYIDIKNKIITQARFDAVEQALGVKVQRRTGLHMIQRDADVSEKLNEITIEKAQGFIQSHDILTESLEKQGNLNLLKLQLLIEVCVPPEQGFREVVAVGDFLLPNGNKDERLRLHLLSAFPSDKRYDLVRGRPEENYHDILVSGKWLLATQTVVNNTAARTITGIFDSVIVTSRGPLNLSKDVPRQLKKLTVSVSVQGLNVVENRVVSETVSVSKLVPVSSGEETINAVFLDLAFKAVRKAAKAVYRELTNL